MNTNEMLTKLLKSNNYHIALLSKHILHDGLKKEYVLRFSGAFMTAVLTGDYASALQLADEENKQTLLN